MMRNLFNMLSDDPQARFDRLLLGSALCILMLGLVMVASSSVAVAERFTGDMFHYFNRQLIFAGIGLVAGGLVWSTPLSQWENKGFALLAMALALLVLVFIPGMGREVNGAQRWIGLGPVNLQVSELARLFLLIYLASYVVRRREEMTLKLAGLLKPLLPMSLACILMLLQPDFGAVVVLMAVSIVVLFVGGARILHLLLLFVMSAGLLAIMAVSSPYRVRRLTSFTDPFANPYDSGFQLVQSLIAIGRGDITGVGLGNSVQKLLYLPETHTDFLFAILAEEMGLIGSFLVIGLFSLLVWRGLMVAHRALRGHRLFGAYLACGLSSWIGMQAFVNLAVNMGLLPTKGLTLPLMSYGGSSLVVMCMAVALILRVDRENRLAERSPDAGKHRQFMQSLRRSVA